VRAFDQIGAAGRSRRLHDLARSHLVRWGLEGARTTVLSTRHNATFRVETPAGRWALRLARPGYQSDRALESELAFLAHVAACGLTVPVPVAGRDGALIQVLAGAGVPGEWRAGLFEWVPGRRRPRPGAEQLRATGALVARLQEAAGSFRPPAWFERKRFDLDGLVGGAAGWSRERIEAGLGPHVRAVARAAARVGRVLEAVGYGPDAFGIIHADVNRGNVRFPGGGRPAAILDFDDMGFGHWALDLATALDRWVAAGHHRHVLDGYAEVRPLPAGIDRLDDFLAARALFVAHWMAGNVGSPAFPGAADLVADTADRLGVYGATGRWNPRPD
jgi:Ser/Thr protein kinase RdoA (MazF antagonist)